MKQFMPLFWAALLINTSNSIAQVSMPENGSLTVNVCNESFYDPGGASHIYAPPSNSVLTICPATPGTFISVSFSSFNLVPELDYLFVYDGNSTDDSIIAGYTGGAIPTAVTATASNLSGCLTFKLISPMGSSSSSNGWEGTITCSPTSGPMPTYDNRDCYKSTFICSDATFAGNSSEAGIHELVPDWIPCASTGERQSSWYYFRMATGGTLGLTINPEPNVDYDFAIWGPYSDLKCPANTFHSPLRCSYAADPGDTGLGNSALDNSEEAYGDKWVAPLPVNDDEIYVMNINNFSQDFTPFNLLWSLQDGASFNCNPLPVELSKLTGNSVDRSNVLEWTTYYEFNNDYFEVQRSEDGVNFSTIGKVNGAGNSNNLNSYKYTDPNTSSKGFYYRIQQVDKDGSKTLSNIIFLIDEEGLDIVSLYPNPPVNEMSIILQSKNDNTVTAEVINSLGQIITVKSFEVHLGINRLIVDVRALETGIYHLRIISASGKHHVEKQFVKATEK